MTSTKSGVYVIRNRVTGKVYVGSSVDMPQRKRTHFGQLRRGGHRSVKLQNSWDKHGADAFEFCVLEATSRDELPLRAAEQVWIDRLNAVAGGYNINPVAGSVGRLPKTDAHKANIGRALLGRKNTPSAIARMVEAAKGRPSRPSTEAQKSKISAANTGKTRTPEMRAALSAARTGMKFGPYTPEHKAAISASKLGKPQSAHHTQRIREGQAAARAKREAAP